MTQSSSPKSSSNLASIAIALAAVVLIALAVLLLLVRDGQKTNSNGNADLNLNSSANVAIAGSAYDNSTYGYRIRYPEDTRLQVDSPEFVTVRPTVSNSKPLPTIKVSKEAADSYVSSLLSEDSLNRMVSDASTAINNQAVRRVVIHAAIGLDFEHNIVERQGYVIDLLGMKGETVFESIRDSLELL